MVIDMDTAETGGDTRSPTPSRRCFARVDAWRLWLLGVVMLGMSGCEPAPPAYLDGPDHSIELPEVPQQYTRPLEPALAAIVDRDRIAWSTSYLHPKWRDGLRRHYREECADSNAWSARQEHRQMITALEELEYFREPTTNPAMSAQIARAANSPQRASKGYIQPLYDELYSAAKAVCQAHRFLDLEPAFAPLHCSSVPENTFLIIARRDLRWSTVQKVVNTAGQFGMQTLQFAVDGEQRALDVGLRRIGATGPPDENQRACALATVSQTKTGLELRYRAAHIVREEAGMMGHTSLQIYPHYLDRPDRAAESRRPSFDWSGALVLPRPGATVSVESGPIANMVTSMRRLHEAFEELPTCDVAVFVGAAPECGDCLTVQRALETLAVIGAAGNFDWVLVSGRRPDGRSKSEQTSDRSIVLGSE
jgi:hypothetical protein